LEEAAKRTATGADPATVSLAFLFPSHVPRSISWRPRRFAERESANFDAIARACYLILRVCESLTIGTAVFFFHCRAKNPCTLQRKGKREVDACPRRIRPKSIRRAQL
jgi:hypothetical protein